jgi:hypothetical protein
VLESLHDKNIKEEIKPFLARVQAGKDKTGIMMNVVDGKPQFIHRTFGEYFAAGWFSKNFKHNRSVLEGILFDRTYGVMTDMFNRMLAKDCPLHCAVIDGDRDPLVTLLKEGSDVNVLDKGGRTLMHVIAAYGSLAGYLRNYIVPLDITDSVLQWKPMQYAIKLGNWRFVNMLLEENVNRSGLEMIRQRVHDRSFIDSIILKAVTSRLLLLIDFLCSIGVKISQSNTRNLTANLFFAVQNNDLAYIRCMLQLGADCNDHFGYAGLPLICAVNGGSLDVVQTLVEEGGASVDVSDYRGTTVIQVAKGYLEHAHQSSRPDCETDEREKIAQYLEDRMSEEGKGKGIHVK